MTIVGLVSAVLNLLGGTGLVKPVVDLRKTPPPAGLDGGDWR